MAAEHRNTHKSLLLGASKKVVGYFALSALKINEVESLVLSPKIFFRKGEFEMDQQ